MNKYLCKIPNPSAVFPDTANVPARNKKQAAFRLPQITIAPAFSYKSRNFLTD